MAVVRIYCADVGLLMIQFAADECEMSFMYGGDTAGPRDVPFVWDGVGGFLYTDEAVYGSARRCAAEGGLCGAQGLFADAAFEHLF
jgi:hypothetical protein